MSRWRQCSKCHKLIPIDEWDAHVGGAGKDQFFFAHGDFKAFRSPIDGKMIESRKQLREHNKRHGVTHYSDYSPEFQKAKQYERWDAIYGKKAKKERLKTLIDNYDRLARR